MKIALLESLGISDELLEQYAGKLKEQGHEFFVYEKETDVVRLKEECAGMDVAIIANMPFPNEVIEACPELKFIDVAFTGVDHVGLDAAKKQGVAVSNASGYSNQSVAELVVGMALTLLRNVPQTDKRCREGQTKDGLVGVELSGKTVGVVGTGAIGKKAAELFHLLGCSVIGYDPMPSPNAPEYLKYVSLEELMEQSDVVTLHCPLMDSTRHLINKDRIARMKPTAVLLNAARGPVLDNEALAEALKAGKLAGAGIDVYEMEPPLPSGYPLLDAPNTILTPHIAFASKESMVRRAEIVFRNLEEWMKGSQINKIL